MDLSEPASALAPGLSVPLLRALASRGDGATAEQLRRIAGVGTAAGVRRALGRLAEHGLLLESAVGERGALYVLNRDHVLFPAIQLLLAAADALPHRIRAALASWRPAPTCAALFGSAARRDGNVDSDVDILIIRPAATPGDDPAWQTQVHYLRDLVQQWTGNHLQVLDRSEAEAAELIRAEEPIVAEWRQDAITVYGRELAEVMDGVT